MNDLSDDEILSLAKDVYRRRRLEYAKQHQQRPEVIARAKVRRQKPERKANENATAKKRYKVPEVRKRKLEQQRRAYWAKHHPGQFVPPGRLAIRQWRQEQDERIRAAEATVTGY